MHHILIFISLSRKNCIVKIVKEKSELLDSYCDDMNKLREGLQTDSSELELSAILCFFGHLIILDCIMSSSK